MMTPFSASARILPLFWSAVLFPLLGVVGLSAPAPEPTR